MKRNPARQTSKPADAFPTAKDTKRSRKRSKAGESKRRRVGGKTKRVLEMLSREGGASIVDLTSATDWLPHTTRAALTGLRKRGHMIQTERKKDGPTVYRLVLSKPTKASRRTPTSKAKA